MRRLMPECCSVGTFSTLYRDSVSDKEFSETGQGNRHKREPGFCSPGSLSMSLLDSDSPYDPAVATPSFAASNGGGPRISMMSGCCSADALSSSKSGGLSASVSSVDGSLASL